jgi:enamine deaminase RidA (YjgF/YER057c/UK114 family)
LWAFQQFTPNSHGRALKRGASARSGVRHADTVYLAGMTGDGDTMAAQAASVLAKVDFSLAEAGTNKANLLSATIYLADRPGPPGAVKRASRFPP